MVKLSCYVESAILILTCSSVLICVCLSFPAAWLWKLDIRNSSVTDLRKRLKSRYIDDIGNSCHPNLGNSLKWQTDGCADLQVWGVVTRGDQNDCKKLFASQQLPALVHTPAKRLKGGEGSLGCAKSEKPRFLSPCAVGIWVSAFWQLANFLRLPSRLNLMSVSGGCFCFAHIIGWGSQLLKMAIFRLTFSFPSFEIWRQK